MSESDTRIQEEPRPTSFSRRNFLKFAAGGIAGATLVGAARSSVLPIPGWPTDNEVPLEDLEENTFARHLGEDFTFQRDSLETVDLELVEVSNFLSKPGWTTGDTFSAVFRGPKDRPLNQATYAVEHKSIGAFSLFIVPIYPDSNAANYEAIFNRI
jgi:hypothetical protein